MPNGGSDCCGTCAFNGVNLGKVQYPPEGSSSFFCEIRKFLIEDPFWTFCNNHPRRNPLWSRIPIGPIWAAVYVSYNTKPMSKDIKIPPELIPPVGDGSYSRIPYYQFKRPVQEGRGICQVCAEQCTYSISLSMDEGRILFCSAAHYFEWWLKSDFMALAFTRKTPLDYDAIRDRFRVIVEKIPECFEIQEEVEKESALKILQEVFELLISSHFGQIDLMHAALFLEHPELKHSQFQEKRSPHLLRVYTELAEAAYLIRRNEPSEKGEFASHIVRMREAIEGFLSEDAQARKRIIEEFIEKMCPSSGADALEANMDEDMEQYLAERLELKKNLIVCLCPTEEKQRFYCTDAKVKEKVGSHFDVVKTYDLYLVNNTNYDIRVEKGGLAPKKGVYVIEKFPYWMFDWSNDYDLRIGVADVVWLNLKFTIKKYGPDKKELGMIPVLNKKAYKLTYLLEWR